MKREGRQHGMVRSFEIWPSAPWEPTPYSTKIVNQVNPPAPLGVFLKVSSKPTNHSKYTGKCSRPRCRACHTDPVSKSMGKTKGTHKERAFVGLKNYLVEYYGEESNCAGYQGLTVLGPYWDEDDVEEEEEEYDDDVDHHVYYRRDIDEVEPVVLTTGGIEEIDDHGLIREEEHDDDGGGGRMSFCEVGFVLEHEDEEWCVVGEM